MDFSVIFLKRILKRSWRDEIKRTFHYDPLKCPNCGTEMELVEIWFEGYVYEPKIGEIRYAL